MGLGLGSGLGFALGSGQHHGIEHYRRAVEVREQGGRRVANQVGDELLRVEVGDVEPDRGELEATEVDLQGRYTRDAGEM